MSRYTPSKASSWEDARAKGMTCSRCGLLSEAASNGNGDPAKYCECPFGLNEAAR